MKIQIKNTKIHITRLKLYYEGQITKQTYNACAYKRLPFFQFDSTQQQTRLNN